MLTRNLKVTLNYINLAPVENTFALVDGKYAKKKMVNGGRELNIVQEKQEEKKNIKKY